MSVQTQHDRTRYQGRRLFHLILALCVPAGLLYLRVVFGLAAADTRVTPGQAVVLGRWSLAMLVAFFVAQLVCAWYLRRLLPASRSRIGNAVQYAIALGTGILFSLVGAIVLEAFGLNFFLRIAGPR